MFICLLKRCHGNLGVVSSPLFSWRKDLSNPSVGSISAMNISRNELEISASTDSLYIGIFMSIGCISLPFNLLTIYLLAVHSNFYSREMRYLLINLQVLIFIIAYLFSSDSGSKLSSELSLLYTIHSSDVSEHR